MRKDINVTVKSQTVYWGFIFYSSCRKSIWEYMAGGGKWIFISQKTLTLFLTFNVCLEDITMGITLNSHTIITVRAVYMICCAFMKLVWVQCHLAKVDTYEATACNYSIRHYYLCIWFCTVFSKHKNVDFDSTWSLAGRRIGRSNVSQFAGADHLLRLINEAFCTKKPSKLSRRC